MRPGVSEWTGEPDGSNISQKESRKCSLLQAAFFHLGKCIHDGRK